MVTPAFFIQACERSGSTLLSALVSQHPRAYVLNDAYVLRELNRVMAPRADWWLGKALARVRSTAQMRALAERSRLPQVDRPVSPSTSAGLVAGLRRFHAEPGREAFRERVAGPALDRIAATGYPSVRALVDAVHGALMPADAGAADVIGEKTPRHVFLAPWIRRSFPDARQILLFRNPVANVAAILKRHARDLDDAIAIYRSYVLAMGLDARDGQLVVRYEDLIAWPDKTLATVHDFLGLEPAPMTHSFSYDRAHYIGSTIDPAREAELQRVLDDAQRARVLAQCEDVCAALYAELLTSSGRGTEG